VTTATIDMDMLTEMRDQGIISNEDFEAQMAAAGLAQHTAPEEVEVELGDEQIGQVEGVIEAIEHREAVYNAQESTVTVDSIVEATPGAPVEAPAEKPKRVKKASGTPKAPSAGGGKRVARAASHGTMGAYVATVLSSSAFELVEGDGLVDVGLLIDSTIEAKKVREKAVNCFDAAFAGKKLSVYSQIAINELRTAGAISAKRLVELYQSGPGGKAYSIGTARSQAQQLVSVLKTLGIVTADMRANPNSTLLSKLASA
jgi:hypothetical protein